MFWIRPHTVQGESRSGRSYDDVFDEKGASSCFNSSSASRQFAIGITVRIVLEFKYYCIIIIGFIICRKLKLVIIKSMLYKK